MHLQASYGKAAGGASQNRKLVLMRLVLFSFLLLFSCANTVSENKQAGSLPDSSSVTSSACSCECSCEAGLCRFYLFEKTFYDLDSLQPLVTAVLPKTHFKECSKFRHRFASPGIWSFEEKAKDTLHWNGSVFSVNEKQQLVITKGKEVKTISLFEGAPGNSNTWPGHLFAKTDNGIVVMIDDQDRNYIFAKYDAGGKEIFKTIVEHTAVTYVKKDNTNYYEPYLMYLAMTPHEMIFTSNPFTKKEITVVVDLDSGAKKEYPFITGGIIRDETETRLAGFTQDRDEELTIHLLNPEKTFRVKKTKWYESSNTVLCDDHLVIACYPRIATGSALMCVNTATGKTEWNADVLQENTAHSEYYNTVTLSLYKNKVIMQGDEANGSYLQFFDLVSGKRLAAFGAVQQN